MSKERVCTSCGVLQEALREIAFTVPVVCYEHDDRRYIDIEQLYTVKRIAADAQGAATSERHEAPETPAVDLVKAKTLEIAALREINERNMRENMRIKTELDSERGVKQELLEALDGMRCTDCKDGILFHDSLLFDLDREDEQQECPNCKMRTAAIAHAKGETTAPPGKGNCILEYRKEP